VRLDRLVRRYRSTSISVSAVPAIYLPQYRVEINVGLEMKDAVGVKVRCEACSEWVAGETTERFLQCDCGKQYMVSVTAVSMQSRND